MFARFVYATNLQCATCTIAHMYLCRARKLRDKVAGVASILMGQGANYPVGKVGTFL